MSEAEARPFRTPSGLDPRSDQNDCLVRDARKGLVHGDECNAYNYKSAIRMSKKHINPKFPRCAFMIVKRAVLVER
jgi:hypothetical protein